MYPIDRNSYLSVLRSVSWRCHSQVETTHERDRLVDHAHLLVLSVSDGSGPKETTHMRPVKRPRLKVTRRSLHHDVRVKAHQRLLRVKTVNRGSLV